MNLQYINIEQNNFIFVVGISGIQSKRIAVNNGGRLDLRMGTNYSKIKSFSGKS
jgi:hypothetical protein